LIHAHGVSNFGVPLWLLCAVEPVVSFRRLSERRATAGERGPTDAVGVSWNENPT
jgi:hypothetical protein